MASAGELREQVVGLLKGGHAHMSFEQAVDQFPFEAVNQRPPNVSYTPWRLLEHIRIAQWDILEFIQNPDHESPPWPEGYWPHPEADADERRWQRTLEGFREDHKALVELAANPETDLSAPLPHAPDYTILRELLVVADHNAYHLGEFAILRQVMGTWPADRAAMS